MADSSRTKRRRLTLLGSAAAALALSVSLAPGAVAGPPGSPGADATVSQRTVDVMTRNLYLGASLDLIIGALSTGDPEVITAAATTTWNQVKASDPELRMAAIADEIAEERPAVVGLQEVTAWTAYQVGTGGAVTPVVVYDFLDLLVDELAERGLTYHEVTGATATNFSSDPIPVDDLPTVAVSIQDRDVLLRRDGVKARNAHNGTFETILEPPDAPIAVPRGWGSADFRTRLAAFRVVNAHTEAWGPEILRVAQVMELFEAQDLITESSGALPTVYVGDYNTAAPSYDENGNQVTAGEDAHMLLRSRLQDSWIVANGTAPGFTCCQAPSLDNSTSMLDERIDFVLTDEHVTTLVAQLIGDTPVDLPGATRWASDHAGVVATLVIDHPSEWRPDSRR